MIEGFAEKTLRIAKKRRINTFFDRVAVAGCFVIAAALLLAGGGVYHMLSHKTLSGSNTISVGAKSKDAPPDYLTIKGERWMVYSYDFAHLMPRPDGAITRATTSCEKRIIWYDSNPITSAEFRTNLWHEVVHAGFCNKPDVKKANWYPYATDLKEHEQVYELGMFMSDFAHDNPEFMKWAEDWK